MNRQKLILTLLLVAFAGSLVYSYLRSPRQVQGPAKSAAPRASAARPKGATPVRPREEGAVHLALLDREQTRSSGYRRNIFSPIFREEIKPPPFKPLPPPPKPVVKPLPPPPPPVQAQPQVQAAPPPPTPEQTLEAQIGKLTFLGFLKKNGDKTVFLSNNGEIILAKKGTTIGGNYVVSDLTDDAITIKPMAGGPEVPIPLMENRALSKRRPSKWTTPP